MTARRGLAAVAVAAAAFGLAIAFVPGLSISLLVPEDATLVVGAGAVLVGLVRAWRWIRRDQTVATVPSTEGGPRYAVPGDELDAWMARLPPGGPSSGSRRALKVRADVRDLAVDVLVHFRGLSPSEAAEALESGEWTDDALAAAFLSSNRWHGWSFAESVAGRLTGDGPFRRRASRTVAALERVAAAEGDE